MKFLEEDNINSPGYDEIEISLLGDGFGESIVIHIGKGKWIIIDSFIEKGLPNNLPVALEYLSYLGINTNEDVILFIITHWHDDHIQGAAQIVQNCENAEVAISSNYMCSHLLDILQICNMVPTNINNYFGSGVSEIKDILNILKSRGTTYLKAIANRLIYNYCDQVKIFTLSPSDKFLDKSMNEFNKLFLKLKKDAENNHIAKRIMSTLNPNSSSIVTWIDIADICLLLGGDIDNYGWQDIFTSRTVIKRGQKAIIYKIAHHGSENSDCSQIWEELLIEKPHAILTPFIINKKLPDKDKINLFNRLTDNKLYISSSSSVSQIKRSNNIVRKQIKRSVKSLYRNRCKIGLVRMRFTPATDSEEIKTDLFADAMKL